MIMLYKKNNSNVDKLMDKMKEIAPKPADERVVFNQWMDDEAGPMAASVIKLMEAIFVHLDAAARRIIAKFVNFVESIVNFIEERASAVGRFFER